MWKTSVVVAPASAVNAPAPLKGGIAETVRNAARIGFDAIQITVNRPAEFDLAGAQQALAACRMRVSGIATGGAYAVDGLCLGHRDEGRRRAAIARMKEHVDLAVRLDGADVVIGLIRGRFADSESKERFMGDYRGSVRECLDYAESRKISIMHEAIGRTDSDVLRTIAENLDFIPRFGSARLKLQVDTHHMGLEETDFHPALLRAGDLLGQVDISDVARGVPDGRHFAFPRLIDALSRIDYRKYIVFEFDSTGDGVAEATAGFRYIRSLY